MKGKLPEGFEECKRIGGGGRTGIPEGFGTVSGSRVGENVFAKGTLPVWTACHIEGIDRAGIYASPERKQILVVPSSEGRFRLRRMSTSATRHVTLTDAFGHLELKTPTKPVRVPLTWDKRGWFVFDLSGYKP